MTGLFVRFLGLPAVAGRPCVVGGHKGSLRDALVVVQLLVGEPLRVCHAAPRVAQQREVEVFLPDEPRVGVAGVQRQAENVEALGEGEEIGVAEGTQLPVAHVAEVERIEHQDDANGLDGLGQALIRYAVPLGPRQGEVGRGFAFC